MWQKIHLYNPILLLEITSKNPTATLEKHLLTEMTTEKHLQSTTWKHAKWRCENGSQNCGKIKNFLSNPAKSYLNFNIEKFDNQSIQEILDKRCNYLMISDISHRVGCEMISTICKKKKFAELKHVKFIWCVLDETDKESHQHFHYGSIVSFAPLQIPA